MSIWSKVLLVFVGLALLGFLYTAARALKTHDVHRTNVVDHERAIVAQKANIETVRAHDTEPGKDDYGNNLLRPVEGSPSISQLEVELQKFLATRGRVWYGVTPQLPVPETGIVSVETGQPDPHRIDPSSVLYVFDQLDIANGGKYLGEFKVTALDGERKLTLEPTAPLSARHKQALTTAAGPWVLYEVMPADRHDVYAGLSDDQLTALLPKPPVKEANEDPAAFKVRSDTYTALVKEFKKDGKKPEPGDEQQHPERIAVAVKFTKQDASAKEVLRGLAIPESVLATGEVYEYDLATAQQLTKAGVAEEVERKYRRSLWDYVALFREFERQEPLMLERIAALDKDLAQMTKAIADAKNQIKFNQDEVARLTGERDRLRKEAALAESRRKKLAGELQQVNTDITKTLASNKQLAQKLATLQQQAAERAEEALRSSQASTAN